MFFVYTDHHISPFERNQRASAAEYVTKDKLNEYNYQNIIIFAATLNLFPIALV